MAEGINVAILKGLIQMDYDPGKLATFLDQLTTAKAKQISAKTEGDKLKASFDKLAASLDPVVARTQKYNQSVDTLNRSLKAGIITQAQYNTHLAQAKQRLQDTTTWTQRLGAEVGGNLRQHFASLINPTTLAIGAIAGIGAAVVSITKQIITASIEAEKSQNQVAFAVEHYGDRAGVTVKQIDDLATAQSRLTGADDEEIASAAALALRFNRLSGDDLPRLIAAAQDMAVVLGIDIPSATDKAAAYINLPVQALTRLKKEGYAVSESQSKLVKDFIRVGDVASAQGVILNILESQYGGAAISARDTLGGAFKALGTTWENLLEKMGEDSTGPLREGIESLIKVIISLTDHVDDLTIGFLNAKIAVNVFTSNALTGLANTVDVLSKAAPLLGILGVAGKKLADTTNLSARARAGAAAADKNAEDAAKALMNAMLGVNDAGKKGKGVASELTEAESKLNDQLKKQREEWQKLLEVAAKAVLASQDELTNTQALLQARKIGIDAMKLEQAVQSALTKAKQAGKAATSEQRLEIIRNSIAIFQAKNAIEDLGEIQKRTTDLFALSNEKMMEQLDILVNLADIENILKQNLKREFAIRVDVDTSGITQDAQERIRFTQDWRDSWKSAREVAQEEIDKIEDSLLEVNEKAAAITQVNLRVFSDNLSQWSSFLNNLGALVGGKFGEILGQISSALDRVQSAGQTGQQLGQGLGQLAGQSGATSSAWGSNAAGILIVAQIFREIYTAVNNIIKHHKAIRFSTLEAFSITDSFWSSSYFDEAGRKFDATLRSLLRSIEQSVGGFLRGLPEIAIRASNDGKNFSAYVAGVFVGIFHSAQEAMEAGVAAAITQADFTGLSEIVQAAIKGSIGATLEELESNVEFARRLDLQNIPDAVRGLMESLWNFHSDFIRAMDLFSQDLSARSGAIGSIITNFLSTVTNSVNSLWDAYNRLTGRVEDPAVQAERDRLAFNTNLTLTRAQIVLMLAEIDARIADLQATGAHARGIVNHGQVILNVTEAIAKSSAETEDLIAQLEAARNSLANIVLPDPLEPGQVKPRRGGRGGGADSRDNVLNFLRSRELALMGDLSGQLAGLNDQYKDEIKSAGKNKDLIAQLVAMREREVAALRDQTRAQLLTPYLGGANAGSRSDFDRQRLDINRAYDDYRTNARALGEAIWKINAAEVERLRLLGLEASAAAGSKTASTILEFQNLGQTINFLRDNAKKLGVDFNKLMAELQGEQLVSFGDRLLSFVDKYYGDSAGFEQFRMDLERTRFELELANMKLQFKLLGDLGLLSEKTIAEVGKIFGFVDSHPVDWGKFVRGDNGIRFKGYDDQLATSVSNVTDNLNQLAESFKSAKDDIRSTLDEISRGGLGVVAPEVAFAAAKEQYDATIRSAKSGELIGFQKASEVAKNYIEALKTFSPALASVSLPSIQEDLKTLLAAPNVRDENVIFSERFGELTTAQEKASALLETGFTAVTNVSQKQTEIQSQMLGQLTELNRSNAELNARLSRLESGTQGNKREVA